MSVEGSDPQSREGKKSQKVSDSHDRNDVSPLTQGLRYRAACDKTEVIVNDMYTKLKHSDTNHCNANVFWNKVHNDSSVDWICMFVLILAYYTPNILLDDFENLHFNYFF